MPFVQREKSTYVKGTAGGLLSVNAGSWKSFSLLCGEWRGRSILLPPAHTLVQLGVDPFLYFQAAMFTLSSFNSCHVCMASACSTGYTFPETKLIMQAVLDSSLGCHGHRKYTPLFPLDNDFSLVLSQLENEAN